MRILIIFIFLITSLYAGEQSDMKNIIMSKDVKKYDSITFLDDKNKQIDLSDFHGNLILC